MRNDILDMVNSFPLKEVSIGYRTVTLFSSDELEKAQIGYSIDKNGQSLTGNADGDWLQSWLVIGYEDETGDPIFIDIEHNQFPVYTAMHGAGDWEPHKIAVSLKSFIFALGYIKELSVGRENPVALEKKPIPTEEQVRVLKIISETIKHIEIDFWETWLENEY
ncbi:hypothetical protein SAMN04487897_14028 [Paenibacillus sp. yr247]|uniref:hypothetical protein n=1 Tax=Paenibacillus sp. yr247 TaxID=1761880 RepID=UPI00088EEC00|nr:hypothetical protein [Paenibacillus sp. yr247]SDP15189.1 hypothetical protein SAMN04487897_14028 [Paenibacillus sp. yr247]